MGEMTIAEVEKSRKQDKIINHIVNPKKYLTMRDIDNLVSQECLDKLQKSRDIKGVYLANSLQQDFIYHTLNKGYVNDAYIVQRILQYNSSLDINKLKESWIYAQKRYSALRLRFDWEEEVIQVIDKEGSLDWRYIDLSEEQDPKIQELQVKEAQEEDRAEQYELGQGNLFRVYIIKQKENLYTCIFSSHHAILDGWSNSVLLSYIHEIYLKLQNQEKIVQSIDHSYEDAQKYLQNHQNDNGEYWNKYIYQIKDRTDLSGLLYKPERLSKYKHITPPEDHSLIIEENLYCSLKKLIQEEGVTLNAILQYTWHKVLNIYGNSSKTIVGTIVPGRNIPLDNIDNSVGLYTNILPLVVNHQTNSIIESVRIIQDNINEMNIRSNQNLAKLYKNGERLFDILFVYRSYPITTSEKQQRRLKVIFKEEIDKLDYPLIAMAYEANDQLIFKLKYASRLFSRDSLGQLLLITETLLGQIAINPNQSVQNLLYLNQAQYKQIIYTYNQTDKNYPYNKTIHQLFEEQVERTPDNIAIIYKDAQLTYKELNKQANQLANYLNRIEVINVETLVAISVERSLEMIVGILGILKAGGAYVPLDPILPQERLNYMLEDMEASLLLTKIAFKNKFNGYRGRMIYLDHGWGDIEKESFLKPICNTLFYNMAYIIYTSGSTGKPKGVMVLHNSVANIIMSFITSYKITAKDKFLQLASISFDDSVNEIFSALSVGSALILPSPDKHLNLNIQYLLRLIQEHKITIMGTIPQLLSEFNEEFFELSSLRLILSGGDVLSIGNIKNLINRAVIVNSYGPTEATICSSSYVLNKKTDYSKKIPIGKPINNYKTYVLDKTLTSLPVGAIGELYIGGVGLARGYLNKPELTAEKFIPNQFQTEKEKKLDSNTRLYKTGDLVRWLPDSNLEYIGRQDSQVKIRGYRIELGEIESVISSYHGIRQNIVLAQEQKSILGGFADNKYLVAYYVSEIKLEEEKILQYLKLNLPEYMVPSILVYLENLPLMISGKVDIKSLPNPEFIGSNSYVAPKSRLEKQICQIWSEVLGMDEEMISINDSFFRLGGDSIMVIKLVSKLNKELYSSITVSMIFKNNSIDKLVEYLENNNSNIKVSYEEWNI